MGDGFSCHITVLAVLVMCAVATLMYAQGPAGQGPGAGCLCCSDGRLAGSSLRVAHHCHKVRGTVDLQQCLVTTSIWNILQESCPRGTTSRQTQYFVDATLHLNLQALMGKNRFPFHFQEVNLGDMTFGASV